MRAQRLAVVETGMQQHRLPEVAKPPGGRRGPPGRDDDHRTEKIVGEHAPVELRRQWNSAANGEMSSRSATSERRRGTHDATPVRSTTPTAGSNTTLTPSDRDIGEV